MEVRLDWFTAHSVDEYPIYVCGADDGQVLGWLSLSLYRGRPALARTAEVSYYVDYACHGKGIGSALMQVAITECPRLGKKVLVAILLEWNIPSIKLLEKFGSSAGAFCRKWPSSPVACAGICTTAEKYRIVIAV